jgi:hypothetical protein
MSAHPDDLTWTQSADPIQVTLDGDIDYRLFGDEQLVAERDRQRAQLNELTRHPSSSPVVDQLRSSIEREVGRMTDELRGRAQSRHPSSSGLSGRLRSLRSLPWSSRND